jgi:sec-independent protein translocase protein TatA
MVAEEYARVRRPVKRGSLVPASRQQESSMRLGLPELLVILVIIILIFGSTRLAGLGKGLGQAIRGFKDEVGSNDKEDEPRVRK